jgi:hypothetical protein
MNSNHVKVVRLALSAVATAVAVAACSNHVLSPAARPVVHTDRSVYEVPEATASSRRVETTLVVTMRNTGTGILWLDGRDFHGLEKSLGGQWVSVYGPIYTMEGPHYSPFNPGESRQFNLALSLRCGINCAPELKTDIPGRYRAVFAIGAGPSVEPNEMPQTMLTVYSNEFEFRTVQSVTPQ